jgi:hypothetical protein
MFKLPKKKISKKVSIKKETKKANKEKTLSVGTPYFPPPYFSTNWGGATIPVTPVAPTPVAPPYFPPPYFSANWGGGERKKSSTDK